MNNNVINTFNDRLQNNICYEYVKSVFDKYKYILLFTIIVVIITFIEVKIAVSASDCIYTLNKNKVLKITPPCLHMNKEDYIYVYNVSNYKKHQIMEKENLSNDYYIKRNVYEHISQQIKDPMKKIKSNIYSFFNSPTPVNNIANSIITTNKIKDVINPMNTLNDLCSNYNVLYPKYLQFNCFIVDGKIYFS